MTNDEKSAIISKRVLGFRDGKTQELFDACMDMAKWKDEQCCANCANLNIYNGKNLYARCAKWGWDFLNFQADTRTTRCGQFEEKKGGKDV